MAIVKMKKATMIALQSEKNEILNGLQRFGYLQVVNLEERMEQGFEELQPDSDNEAVGRLEAKLSQVKYSLDFLGKFNTAKKPLFAQKVQVDETKRKEYLDNEEKLNEIYENCRSIDSRFTEIKSSETKLNNAIAQLTPWLTLKEKLEEIGTTHNTNSILGFIASKYEEELSAAVKDEDLTAYLEKVGVEKENSYFMVIYHQTCEERISQLLKQVGWTKVTFSEYSGTPEENINRIKVEISNLENVKKELAKKAEAMVPESGFLEILYDLLSIEKDRRSVVKDFIKTDKTFMLQGWIPEKFADNMTKLMDDITDKYTISFEDPSEEDEIPVLLNNPKPVKPYEMITDLYSVPNAKGIDPNIFMAPFFVVFFGMMVTDAVYGIFMSALTGYVLYKYKPQGGMKSMMWIMFFGGISTFFWGGIFGGWLGDLIKVKPWWFNPLDEPLKMLIFCLILGVIHLYTGYILQAYQNIKAGNIMDAIYDQVLWLMLLTGLMFLALPPLAVIGKYMAIIGALGTVIFAARSEKNIFKRLISGVLALYNVSGFLGDVLSYSRLFALCLATGVIAQVFNAMGLMMGGSIVGKVIMVAFLAFAHVFNTALGILGAYVHTSRLQYVEFFGKFYEGEGKPFNPLRIRTKYIQE
ncbi:MAG TPA: V-type ATP synthase subunit I [Bacillota bacterium]|nr:V-type ATP synthase subunit I [Bacillota bacterium]HOS70328.1 V-type ATP synthase subunit I [Bacillota bacterium]HQJ38137.1 V-type ATP synthase subunit I [Bacillota bacterium]HQL36681.1 V-type ATP synthase subunit I [Bacillota bacterium]